MLSSYIDEKAHFSHKFVLEKKETLVSAGVTGGRPKGLGLEPLKQANRVAITYVVHNIQALYVM